MISKAQLIAIIAAYSVRGSKTPDDLAKWRRDLAQGILDAITAQEAGNLNEP